MHTRYKSRKAAMARTGVQQLKLATATFRDAFGVAECHATCSRGFKACAWDLAAWGEARAFCTTSAGSNGAPPVDTW